MPAHSAMKTEQDTILPIGVTLTSLTTHPDERGELTEIFRNEWHHSPLPLQWIVSRSAANTLRGVHVHAHHWDYFCVVAGEIVVGLHDLRPAAPTVGRSAMLRLNGAQLQMLVIPAGVAHGFYSPGDSMHVIGTSRYYDPTDHQGCRWNSPELALDWPCTTPALSAQDRAAGSYDDFRASFLAISALPTQT
jgi:dTDP-4-dehydrorhamnose 3,5-epimerase